MSSIHEPQGPLASVKHFSGKIGEALMSSKVKIGIAVVIVIALGAVVGYDLMHGKKAGDDAASNGTGLTAQSTSSEAPCTQQDFRPRLEDLLERTPAPPPTTRVVEPTPPLPAPSAEPAPSNEEYVVQSGDTLESIAEKKYGNGGLWNLIAKANPKIKPSAMRVGAKLVIPTRTTTVVEAPTAEAVVENNVKTYEIQPSDTLDRIARRFYKTTTVAATAAAVAKIREANDVVQGDHLDVGTKIILPEIVERAENVVARGEPGSSNTTANVDPAVASAKTYKVQAGDSLWKIAAKYHGGKGTLSFMDDLVRSNSDKLKSTGTTLKAGWVLALPE